MTEATVVIPRPVGEVVTHYWAAGRAACEDPKAPPAEEWPPGTSFTRDWGDVDCERCYRAPIPAAEVHHG